MNSYDQREYEQKARFGMPDPGVSTQRLPRLPDPPDPPEPMEPPDSHLRIYPSGTCECCGELLQPDGTCELKCEPGRDGEHPSLEELNGGSPGPDTTGSGKCVEAHLANTIQALSRIAAWELPDSGFFWENADGSPSDRPMSFGGAYGSNGERDYIKGVARSAIEGVSQTWPQALPLALAERMARAIMHWSCSFTDVARAEYELNTIAEILVKGGFK